MKIRDLMQTRLVTLRPDSTLFEAALKMEHHGVGALPVVTPMDEILGIVTDRDLVIRGLAMGLSPDKTTVDSLMTRDVVTADPDDEAEQALHDMANEQVRRVPVVEHGALVGMVSLGDLSQHRLTNERAGEALSRISSSR